MEGKLELALIMKNGKTFVIDLELSDYDLTNQFDRAEVCSILHDEIERIREHE